MLAITAIATELETRCNTAAEQFDGLDWDSDPQTAARIAKRDGDLMRFDRHDACDGTWGGRGDWQAHHAMLSRFRDAVDAGDVETVLGIAEEEAEDVAADAKDCADEGKHAVEYAREGDLDEALKCLERAVQWEGNYGDAPAWGPVHDWLRKVIEERDEARDDLGDIESELYEDGALTAEGAAIAAVLRVTVTFDSDGDPIVTD